VKEEFQAKGRMVKDVASEVLTRRNKKGAENKSKQP
jgi:hypothetical protein